MVKLFLYLYLHKLSFSWLSNITISGRLIRGRDLIWCLISNFLALNILILQMILSVRPTFFCLLHRLKIFDIGTYLNRVTNVLLLILWNILISLASNVRHALNLWVHEINLLYILIDRLITLLNVDRECILLPLVHTWVSLFFLFMFLYVKKCPLHSRLSFWILGLLLSLLY